MANAVETPGEAVLDPDIPIVDAHHHLYERGGTRYLLDEILRDVGAGHNIRATVFVESKAMYRQDGPPALHPVGEVEFANGVAAMSASGNYGPCRLCAGIVGCAELTLGAAVEETLVAEIARGGGRFRGIRQGSYWDDNEAVYSHTSARPPRGLLMDGRFREGFARLAPLGLSFDAVLFHPQLPELLDLARSFPETTIVLNHMGFPLGIGKYADRREEVFQVWRESMRELATCPAVHVKIGGLGMAFWGFGFDERTSRASSEELAAAWRPYVETTIALFGADRCMFESNFPPDRRTCSYVVMWNALKQLAAQSGAAERSALFSGTASKVYRLTLG